eukprot:snap_masked-scaffold_3-processed-gene-8.11-mRNA-1 protein AED:1.00 eAED:1.00 QI:0/0/0/0/1/1/3/0/95
MKKVRLMVSYFFYVSSWNGGCFSTSSKLCLPEFISHYFLYSFFNIKNRQIKRKTEKIKKTPLGISEELKFKLFYSERYLKTHIVFEFYGLKSCIC